MRKKHITVVIADDHAILRAGLRMLLNQQPDIKVVGEAENGEHALEQVRLNKPDIILMDISMPGTGGVEATAEIRRKSPQTRVVILTMHAESAYLDSVLAAGASGYVLKRSLDSDLLKAIRSAQLGLNPSSDGEIVRLPMPPLTEERRKELVKLVKKMAEEAKVHLRGGRRDANDKLKELLKDKAITEDEEKQGLKRVQDTTDAAIAKVDDLVAKKEQEIMEV